jgi:hypothetical protein
MLCGCGAPSIELEITLAFMSIRTRLEDAVFLWRNDRKEGALLSLLVAVAATSRKRFPSKHVRDVDAFERFVASAHPFRLSVEFRGELHPIEHVLYKWLRCELVHEGVMPVDIEFTPTVEPGVLSVRAGGTPTFVLLLSESWIEHLVSAVVTSPENASTLAGWHP